MGAHNPRRRRSAFAPAPLLLLLVAALSGCVRGCSGFSGCECNCNLFSHPSPPCKSDADCPTKTACREGVCASTEHDAQRAECRASPVCKRFGACGVAKERSFLGASNTYVCAAESEDDCKQSIACTVWGRCAIDHNDCVAASAAACESSEFCKAFDECTLSTNSCISAHKPCVTSPGWAARWGSIGALSADTKGLEPAKGPVDGDTLVCTVSQKGTYDTVRVRAGEGCPIDVDFGKDDRDHVVVLPAVHVSKGDGLAFALIDHELSGASAPQFVKILVDNTKPLSAELGEASVDCRRVPAASAALLAGPALAAADRHLAVATATVGAPISRFDDLASAPRGIVDAEHDIAAAAAWIGWDHETIRRRVAQVDALTARWASVLGGAFASFVKGGSSGNVESAGVRVSMGGAVCGEALRARIDKGAPGVLRDAKGCAREIVLENHSKRAVERLGFGGPRISALVKTSDGAAFAGLAFVDWRSADSPTEAPNGNGMLDPGARRIVLLAPATDSGDVDLDTDGVLFIGDPGAEPVALVIGRAGR